MAGQNFIKPVAMARQIMDHSDHCALTGEGALEFARSNGFDHCDPKLLISDDAKHYKVKNYKEFVKTYFPGKKPPYDSVTDVALDSQGHFACATSTG